MLGNNSYQLVPWSLQLLTRWWGGIIHQMFDAPAATHLQDSNRRSLEKRPGAHLWSIWARKMRRKPSTSGGYMFYFTVVGCIKQLVKLYMDVYGLSTSQSSSGYLSGNQPNICSQMWLAQIEFCSLRMRKLLSNGTIYLMYANCDIT
jgi:hypothetical protein